MERTRGWLVAVMGLLAIMALMGAHTVVRSALPDPYAQRHLVAPWIYPTHAVVTWLAAMVIEGAIAAAVLAARTRASLGGRALVLAALMFLGVAALAAPAMHAGTAVIDHLAWLFFGSLWLVVFALGRAISLGISVAASNGGSPGV